jgi:ATP-binding cassette subfamily F protein uup
LDQASLAYGHVALLDRCDLSLDDGERVALIGRNGSGKSSLLRVLAGLGALDHGTVWLRAGAKVAYVAQEPRFDCGADVYDTIAGALGAVAEQLIAYHDLSAKLGDHPGAADLERLHELQSRLEHGDGWRLNTRIEQTLSAIGLAGTIKIGALSGGMLKRVALGCALVIEPDLLLLDEPTNHLDLDGIDWLEAFVQSTRATSLIVTHDRRFLDRIATRIIELDRGALRSYAGQYAQYQARKAEELSAQDAAQARFDKLLAQEEVWIRKGIEARRTRNEGRVRRLEHLRRERAMRRERLGSAQLAVDRGELSGKLVAELSHVCKAYARADGRQVVVQDFSCRILRGDKIGVMGPNGCGKTTLLRLMLGELKPDSGSVRLGTRIQIAYFDQFRAVLDLDATLASVISPGSEFVEIAGRRQHVIGYLGEFLFPPERARSVVRALSGGERNRLLLARLFARPANVIVLDEPTNDLDTETLELLEALLADYDGTVLLVSHDRAFLDNCVTQTIAYEDDGLWREYAGGYEDWRRSKDAAADVLVKPPAETGRKARTAEKPREQVSNKLSYKERRELEALPAAIDALENEQRTLAERLAEPALYQRAAQDVPGLQKRLREVDAELELALERWEALASREQGS